MPADHFVLGAISSKRRPTTKCEMI
jgi:hypothetical protein